LRDLLVKHRGLPPLRKSTRLTVEQILAWADSQHRQTGKWPSTYCGPVLDSPEDDWQSVDHALRRGHRGLAGGSSLAKLLRECRHGLKRSDAPPLKIEQILAWADAHHERTGKWPHGQSGPVVGADETTWTAVDAALRHGCRGLPGGSSLAKLLTKERDKKRGKKVPSASRTLNPKKILAWARAYRKRTGKWPSQISGPVDEVDGLTWRAIDSALRNGYRGLPGGSSLPQFLKSHQSAKKK
jgi:hypothetical protein